MKPKQIAIAIAVLAIGGAIFYITAGKKDGGGKAGTVSPTSTKATVADSGLDGPSLVERHCTDCHLLPTSDQLPREAWPFVLTWMGNYLGYKKNDGPFARIALPEFTPPKPTISPKDFKILSDYLTENARTQDQMRIERPRPPDTTRFKATVPSNMKIPLNDVVTLIKAHPARPRLYVSSGYDLDLRAYDTVSGEVVGQSRFPTEPIDMGFFEDGFRLSFIGSFERDTGMGAILDIRGFESKEEPKTRMLLNGYHRLTQTLTHDLDGDGREDILAVGFGDGYAHVGNGRVSILWATEGYEAAYDKAPAAIPNGPLSGALTETVLMKRAGVLGGAIEDFNKDGKPDIVLISAQAHQELLLFINEGKRGFKQIVVQAHPAGWGHNHLSIADFDGDGHQDLIVSNGNNMEIEDPPLKPYHGVRIYQNNGDLTFTERAFYPFYGAIKAMARDFDGDGDLDIAAIAFYPDWSLKFPETFVYLENQGGWKFSPSGLPDTSWGRWLTMDIGDLNHDNIPDIALGLGSLANGIPPEQFEAYKARFQTLPSVLFLLNRGG